MLSSFCCICFCNDDSFDSFLAWEVLQYLVHPFLLVLQSGDLTREQLEDKHAELEVSLKLMVYQGSTPIFVLGFGMASKLIANNGTTDQASHVARRLLQRSPTSTRSWQPQSRPAFGRWRTSRRASCASSLAEQPR